MQQQQQEAKIEKVSRRFYPPSLVWFHLFDTQLLSKCQSESFPMACELCVSGLRCLTQNTPGSEPSAHEHIVGTVPRPPGYYSYERGSYFRFQGASWMKIVRWNGGSQVSYFIARSGGFCRHGITEKTTKYRGWIAGVYCAKSSRH